MEKVRMRDVHQNVRDLVKVLRGIGKCADIDKRNFFFQLIHCYIETLDELCREGIVEQPTILTMARYQAMQREIANLKRLTCFSDASRQAERQAE